MANNLNTRPMIIDTFDVDFIIGGKLPVTITKIVFNSADATDVFALKHNTPAEDNSGLIAVRIDQTVDLTNEIDYGPNGHIFPHGLYFDENVVNAGLNNGTDSVLIYTR